MKGVLLKMLAVALPFTMGGMLLYATRTHGDVPSLPAKPDFDIPVVGPGGQINVTGYANGDIMAVWPVLAFKADPKTGHVAVDLESPLKPGNLAKVSIQLILNPSPLLKAAQNQIAAREGKTPKLSSVILRELTIEQQASKQAALFEKFSLLGESSGSGELTLVAYMPDADAKVFAEELRTGKRHVEFRVLAKLYATRTTSEVAARARVAKIKDTKAYTALDGTGGAARVKNESNAVSMTAAPVTRHQEQELTAKVADEVVLALQITGSPKQMQIIVDQVKEFMKSAFGAERTIELTVKELEKLNPYGFDPNDTKPDIIEKFVADVNNFFFDERKDTISFAAGGSGWGVTVGVKYDKESLKKTLSDGGWNFTEDGKKYLPRSITVRDLNSQKIDAHMGFTATLSENEFAMLRYDQQVTTRARIALDLSDGDLNRLGLLERQVKALMDGRERQLKEEAAIRASIVGEWSFHFSSVAADKSGWIGSDSIVFSDDGTFRFKNGEDKGKWNIDGHLLVIEIANKTDSWKLRDTADNVILIQMALSQDGKRAVGVQSDGGIQRAVKVK